MPKLHYKSNKFKKIAKCWGSPPEHPLIFDFGDLKLCDFAKLCF